MHSPPMAGANERTGTLAIGRDDWPTVLRAQGRTYRWLAGHTGKSPATVAAYACKARVAPNAWLAETWTVLGFPELAERAA